MKKHKYSSYESIVDLSFLQKPFKNHTPDDILYHPVEYYTLEKVEDEYEVAEYTVRIFDKFDHEIDELLFDADELDTITTRIASTEEDLVKEATDKQEVIFTEWKKDRVYDTVIDLEALLNKNLPNDINKTPYVDFKVISSLVSESLYVHFTKDSNEDWYDNENWDLKVRFSSHEIPSSAGIYGKTHLNFEIDEESKPEKLYKTLLYWLNNLKEKPKYTEYIKAILLAALRKVI